MYIENFKKCCLWGTTKHWCLGIDADDDDDDDVVVVSLCSFTASGHDKLSLRFLKLGNSFSSVCRAFGTCPWKIIQVACDK